MTNTSLDNTNRLKSDPSHEAMIRSISDFFKDHGASPCGNNERPSVGMVHIHFSNPALLEELSFSLPEEKLSSLHAVFQALQITEPFSPSMKVEFHQPENSNAPVHLEFLRDELPSNRALELLEKRYPERPIDVLRNEFDNLKNETERGIPMGQGAYGVIQAKVEQLLTDVVTRYYPLVDRGGPEDLQEIADMFAPEGVYDRAGIRYAGKENIEIFYKEDRTLEGSHKVHSLVPDRLNVYVSGVFEGHSHKNNSPRYLEFTDTWQFDLRGYIFLRHTYLSQGHDLTT